MNFRTIQTISTVNALVFLVAIILTMVGGYREFLSKSPTNRDTNRKLFTAGSVMTIACFLIAFSIAMYRPSAISAAPEMAAVEL